MISAPKTVGSYEAKTKLPELLKLVEGGREIIITRHSVAIARLIPSSGSPSAKDVFQRIRALRSRIALGKGESTRDLIEAGRRI